MIADFLSLKMFYLWVGFFFFFFEYLVEEREREIYLPPTDLFPKCAQEPEPGGGELSPGCPHTMQKHVPRASVCFLHVSRKLESEERERLTPDTLAVGCRLLLCF